jgi:hypothetical protein
VTHKDIVNDRRVQLIGYVAKSRIGNVTGAGLSLEVSRGTYYGWIAKAAQYKLSAS